MKRILEGAVRGVVFLFLVLMCATYMRAQEACSAKSLQGGFGFSLTGANVAAGVQFAFAGRFEADGKGHFTGAGTQSVSGNVSRTPFKGTYTVNPDCTGSAAFVFANGAMANLDFVLVGNGDEIFIIVSDQGTLETGTAKKQSSNH